MGASARQAVARQKGRPNWQTHRPSCVLTEGWPLLLCRSVPNSSTANPRQLTAALQGMAVRHHHAQLPGPSAIPGGCPGGCLRPQEDCALLWASEGCFLAARPQPVRARHTLGHNTWRIARKVEASSNSAPQVDPPHLLNGGAAAVRICRRIAARQAAQRHPLRLLQAGLLRGF